MVILQQYLADMDIEGYNIVGDGYRDKYFEKTLEEVKKCNGKILLYKDNEKIVGLIVGIINNDDTIRYDFKAPKRGRITELVVDKDYRGKGIGKILTDKIECVLDTKEDWKIEKLGEYNLESIKKYYSYLLQSKREKDIARIPLINSYMKARGLQ